MVKTRPGIDKVKPKKYIRIRRGKVRSKSLNPVTKPLVLIDDL